MKRVEKGTNVLKDMGVDGYIGFSVKAKDTESNREVIRTFLSFAKDECDDNYTLAIKRLVDNNMNLNLLDVLAAKVLEVETRVEGVEEKISGKKKDDKSVDVDDGVF